MLVLELAANAFVVDPDLAGNRSGCLTGRRNYRFEVMLWFWFQVYMCVLGGREKTVVNVLPKANTLQSEKGLWHAVR